MSAAIRIVRPDAFKNESSLAILCMHLNQLKVENPFAVVHLGTYLQCPDRYAVSKLGIHFSNYEVFFGHELMAEAYTLMSR